MIENNLTPNRTSNAYQKKITAYLDGSLSAEDRSEFEAYVATHPEFENVIKAKEEELLILRSMIPATSPSLEIQESLENEMRLSAYHLLKEEPKSFWERIQNQFEEWSNR